VFVAGRQGSLAWLSLQSCPNFTAEGLTQLASFQRLRYLDLSETSVQSVRCLQACTALCTLRLSGCEQLQHSALAGLGALPNLARLDLRRSCEALTPSALRVLWSVSSEAFPFTSTFILTYPGSRLHADDPTY
jgi:hypothetical protein